MYVHPVGPKMRIRRTLAFLAASGCCFGAFLSFRSQPSNSFLPYALSLLFMTVALVLIIVAAKMNDQHNHQSPDSNQQQEDSRRDRV